MQDGDGVGGKLKGVAVAARDQSLPFASRFLGDGRGKEVVGFIARPFGIGEATGSSKFRKHVQLLDQLVIKLTAALVGREQGLTVGWRAERIPTHEYCARPLAFVQPQQEVGEADHGAGAAIARPPDRFRQRVVGAVGEVVAVHSEQGTLGVTHILHNHRSMAAVVADETAQNT